MQNRTKGAQSSVAFTQVLNPHLANASQLGYVWQSAEKLEMLSS